MASVQYKGRLLEYEWHGDGDGVPLVLVMGMAGSLRGWLPLQVPDFSTGRKVLLFNHRGVGASEDDGKDFSTADLADDLVGLLDALSVATVDALGLFMGGMAVQELALRHPARLRKLVLTGTYARADAKRRMLLQHWAALASKEVDLERIAHERLLWSLQDETLEQTDIVDALTAFLAKEGTPLSSDVFVRQCQACIEHDAYDRLRGISHETLVISGRNDQLTPPKFHRELADEIPNARLITIQYGAHLLMMESAERFNHMVVEFLDDH